MAGNRQWVLARRPTGKADESCFELVEDDVPGIGDQELLIRTTHLIMEPAIRGWLNPKGSGYLPGVEIGAAVRGAGLGEVVASNLDAIAPGTIVQHMTHWREYSVASMDPNRPFEQAGPVPDGADPLHAATVLSSPGYTAYAATTRLLQPTADDAVLVTGASSLVGSLACQLAKRTGAYVVGTAGSPEKCSWLVDDVGIDACIDYRAEDLDSRLKELFPSGITAVFDNVGGSTLDTVLRRIAIGARVVLVGSLSRDNETEPYRLGNYDRLMSRRATMMGYNTIDHIDLIEEAQATFLDWIAEGSLVPRVKVWNGLESAPDAFMALYDDPRPGKPVVVL